MYLYDPLPPWTQSWSPKTVWSKSGSSLLLAESGPSETWITWELMFLESKGQVRKIKWHWIALILKHWKQQVGSKYLLFSRLFVVWSCQVHWQQTQFLEQCNFFFTSDSSILPSLFLSNFCMNSAILSLKGAFEVSWNRQACQEGFGPELALDLS